jgi:hypothetical protein
LADMGGDDNAGEDVSDVAGGDETPTDDTQN